MIVAITVEQVRGKMDRARLVLLKIQLATGTFEGGELAEDDQPGWRGGGREDGGGGGKRR